MRKTGDDARNDPENGEVNEETAADGAGGDTSAEQDPPAICALEGCDQPLPERPLDEHGRRRPGRRPRYCSKAHADQASRQRRALETSAVTGPLQQAEELRQKLVPLAGQLTGLLTDLAERFDKADEGALARIATAEAEAQEARLDAVEAVERRQEAEQARRSAMAEARAAARERDEATFAAERNAHEADQIRTAAWEQVAVHERSRGEAEAARQSAEEAVARVSEELHRVVEARDRERARAERTATELREARADTERARAEQAAAREATSALESARDQALAERDRLLAELEQTRTETERLRTDLARSVREGTRLTEELGQERAGRTVAEQRLTDARRDAEECRAQSVRLQDILLTLERGQETS